MACGDFALVCGDFTVARLGLAWLCLERVFEPADPGEAALRGAVAFFGAAFVSWVSAWGPGTARAGRLSLRR